MVNDLWYIHLSTASADISCTEINEQNLIEKLMLELWIKSSAKVLYSVTGVASLVVLFCPKMVGHMYSKRSGLVKKIFDSSYLRL